MKQCPGLSSCSMAPRSLIQSPPPSIFLWNRAALEFSDSGGVWGSSIELLLSYRCFVVTIHQYAFGSTASSQMIESLLWLGFLEWFLDIWWGSPQCHCIGLWIVYVPHPLSVWPSLTLSVWVWGFDILTRPSSRVHPMLLQFAVDSPLSIGAVELWCFQFVSQRWFLTHLGFCFSFILHSSPSSGSPRTSSIENSGGQTPWSVPQRWRDLALISWAFTWAHCFGRLFSLCFLIDILVIWRAGHSWGMWAWWWCQVVPSEFREPYFSYRMPFESFLYMGRWTFLQAIHHQHFLLLDVCYLALVGLFGVLHFLGELFIFLL